MRRNFLMLLAVLFVLMGCGGSYTQPTPVGEEYYVATWYPFDSDRVQRIAAESICRKYGANLLRRNGYWFWTILTPAQVSAMEQDKRVALVGEYFISLSKPYVGERKSIEIVNEICSEYGIRQTDTVFAHFFSAQMTVKMAATLEKDPRIAWVSLESIGGAAGLPLQVQNNLVLKVSHFPNRE